MNKKNNIKNVIMNIIIIICMALSYWIIDFSLRYLSYDTYKFYSYKLIAPSLFTLGWASIFIGLFYLIPQKKRQIYYLITLIVSNILGLSQYLHFKCLERFYGISDIFLVKEGSKYFNYAILKIDKKILTIILLSLLLGTIVIKLSKKYHERYRDKLYFSFLIIFTLICATTFTLCAKFRLGHDDNLNSYDASISALEVYNEFNNPNKNMQVTGLYTSLSRGISLYINKKINNNTEELTKEINTYIEGNSKTLTPNEYTGIFKDKNLIVILMESIDTFLINEESMPTLYKLSNEGLNFTNRYAPSFGGGQTINSEFALNTGLYTSLEGNIYNYTNTYKTSLANIFKEQGYSANSIHCNSGNFYNRSQFHLNLGFNKHYALLDMNNIDNNLYNYEFDSNLIKSPKVSNLIIRDNKFLSFITTYSAHLPYNASNTRCTSNKYDLIVSGNGELSCIYNLAYDTDEMIRLLIEQLDQKGILQDTVLVLATDHAMIGYSKINEEKNTDNPYLIQHTPLIIWNSEIEGKTIDTPVDTADILPTILNLFGYDYNPNLYVGEDAFSTNRNNYIYFSEDIYYQDNILYDKTTNPGEASIYQEIKETIKFNNNLVESNYLQTD